MGFDVCDSGVDPVGEGPEDGGHDDAHFGFGGVWASCFREMGWGRGRSGSIVGEKGLSRCVICRGSVRTMLSG